MADESLATPEKRSCTHVWKKVIGATLDDGSFTCVCEKCETSRVFAAPVHESGKDERPLLME